ncbi:FliI/YscN family ATPase [Roseinatronobacter alkalisoli]|uniref:FliI/YscN family ATPase n=1 Tax=Roseinatronobacter alkalisoli TaxID=3028235 RepID=A0ABT5T4W0_9RHOB|nr:FliI/YscN family ATPase [Roseinatronobacter sp. HJB301]MDD7970150.1 FliI/YscN family ATPase [Roseinatronobacter sp. HJB301]
MNHLDLLRAEVAKMRVVRVSGRIMWIDGQTLGISGLIREARIGDWLEVGAQDGTTVHAEILRMTEAEVIALPDGPCDGLAIGDRAELIGSRGLAPDDSWIGRVIDPYGQSLDGRPILPGPVARPLRQNPPDPARRGRLGARLNTGMAVFNTLLPLVEGQRIGLFAGSGVGKSMLLGNFARNMQADVVVIALIGERGRELRDFIEDVLGPEGMARSVVVTATSDQPPLTRRRCAAAAMCVAEYFRDQGKQVLYLADSITRLAEAHREVALSGGEDGSLRGFPPSTAHQIMALAERAGPGLDGVGAITGIFTVLVAGSDMEEPVADILRGVLDGHVVMDRAIAERGRFPAIDVLRSVSRALPKAATPEENARISEARRMLGAYDRAEMMIQAGLYDAGSDPLVDRAIRVWPALDAFVAEPAPGGIRQAFARLAACLDPPAKAHASTTGAKK